MSKLQEDVALNGAIEAIYETALDPDHWRSALGVITKCFDAEGTILFFERSDGSHTAVTSPGLLDIVAERFERDGWTRRDLRAIRALETNVFGRQSTVTDQDLMTPEEIETHPYYTEFLGPSGLAWFVAASVSPDPDIFVALSVQRAKRKPIFGPSDRRKLEILARHTERSLRLSSRLVQTQIKQDALGDALEHVGCGVLLLNDSGQVVFQNGRGAVFLGNTGAAPNRTLIGRSSIIPPALREQIATTLAVPFGAQPDAGKPILLTSHDGEPPTVAYVLPVASATKSALVGFAKNVCAIVLLINQRSDQPVDATIVRDLLGLTLGEARVASLVGFGHSTGDVAGHLGISQDTAKSVLDRVFAKTSISKQSHLAALLQRITLQT
jgi:DNA-binding CsgD family transcriptional regulator